MKLSFFQKRLFAPLYVSFTVLLVLLLTQEGLSLAVNLLKQRAVDGVIQSFKVKRESERLLGMVLEQKVALRGYLLTDDEALLSQYQSGKANFYGGLSRLYELLKEDPEQQANLDAITTFHEHWQSQFVQPLLQGSMEPKALEASSSLNTLRNLINDILVHERNILNEHTLWLERLEQLNQLNLILSALSIGLIVLGSGFNFLLLRRRVVAPLQQLMLASHSWSQGQLRTSIDYHSEDEIGQLSATLNGMAKDIRIRQDTIQQRNAQLEDLISTLSHDLRTPLLANRSTLDAIAGGAFGHISSELQEILEEYRIANHDLIHLVEALLDISRYEAKGSQILNREVLNWHKICQRITHWIQTSSNNKCRVQVHIASPLPQVSADSLEIQRVLQNLVDNAVRLSAAGSEIFIDVTAPDSGFIQVAVQDNGPGLKKQEARQVFYRFSQGSGRQGRAGLGLYLCRQIIEAHGGSIGVRSQLGEGAKFWFTLPAQSPLEARHSDADAIHARPIEHHV